MLYFLAVLYAVAAACSLWGAFSPSIRACRRARKGERARARVYELQRAVNGAHGDEEAVESALRRQRDELAAPFEGGPGTLDSWGRGGIGTTSEADRARAESESRRAGLGWVGVGVALGSVASIIGLWL